MVRGTPTTVFGRTALQGTATISASLVVGTHLWVHWAAIAIEAAESAQSARVELEALQRANKPLPMERELRPALIAVAAASHALDAIYGELKSEGVVPPALAAQWAKSRPGRWKEINETLKLAAKVRADRWERELKWLYDLRDAAVHPELTFAQADPHPLGLNVSVVHTTYTCEAATRAVALLLDVLNSCASNPKAAAAKWASASGGSIAQFAH
jgi:hypothetical protein